MMSIYKPAAMFVLMTGLAGCSALAPAGPTALAPGMTRQQVVAVMGNPTGFSSAPGGIECLTFATRQVALSVSPMTQTQVVTLKDGVVVKSEMRSPLQSWTGADATGSIGKPNPSCSL